ncbi:MAG: geranyl transferase [Gammaproteobacteria bacterium]|mgnify:CR=1 FL=1|uniref:Geranyl transferase n=1 Tax=OM182 bacterium MED-G24 TaxID=1986255 RepID=A0A2A5WZG7_9GAMM|nr:geranyl transferase [Gammaproteobacteria bacterium]PDH41919.1 MAG: geranyl transferase [OM182 bacterium MED-G24]RPG27496.1 MAG: polyprenyl synthetase family protein [Gammaproteobacteria bacterium TMED50]
MSPAEPPESTEFVDRVDGYISRIDGFIAGQLPDSPDQFHQALRYAALGAGKRIRPLLTYATGEALGVPADILDYPAAALEMTHTYSLVHDDLPAMDDDDLRRGRATVHVAWDEATAILVGDALQAMAFEILAKAPVEPPIIRNWVSILATGAGHGGMVGGQVQDMAGEQRSLTEQELRQMHAAKTGKLISAGPLMAAAAANASEAITTSLVEYGHHIGLAFQIKDDVLDVTQSTEALGKPQGSDAGNRKSTFVTLLGLDESIRQLTTHYGAAVEALSAMAQSPPEGLKYLADYIANREK